MQKSVINGFTEAQAAQLTSVSPRQLGYWAADGFFTPSLQAGMKLYSFRDLVCLKVLNRLRNEAKIPLQELRRTKRALVDLGDHLRAETPSRGR